MAIYYRRTYSYFVDTQGWTEYNTGFKHALEYEGRQFIGGLSNQEVYPASMDQGGIWQTVADTGSFPPATFNEPVTSIMKTGWIRLGGPGARARVRRIEMTISGDTENNIEVRMYRDFDEDNIYRERNVVLGVEQFNDVNPGERVLTLDGWGNRITTVQFEVLTTRVNIENLDIFYTGGTPGAGQNLRGERHSSGVGGGPYTGGG